MIEWEMLVALAAVVLGSLIVLVPVSALALRFASKPIIEALARYKEVQSGSSQQMALLKERMELLEHRLEGVESGMERLSEGQDFDRRLHSP